METTHKGQKQTKPSSTREKKQSPQTPEVLQRNIAAPGLLESPATVSRKLSGK